MQVHNPHSNKRVIIVGGGVIGIGIGWQLAKAGCTVSIYERIKPDVPRLGRRQEC